MITKSSHPIVDSLLTQISKLSKSERRLILKAIEAQDGEQPEVAEFDWLLTGLDIELRKAGLLATSLDHERLKSWSPKYKKNVEQVRGFIEEYLPKEHLPRVQMVALGRLLSRCLIRWLGDYLTRHGARAAYQHIPDIPTALQSSFPGYLQSGLLLPLVLDVRRKSPQNEYLPTKEGVE